MDNKTQTYTDDSKPAIGGAEVDATADRLAAGAHQGIDAASKAAHPMIDRAAASAHHAVDHADELAGQAAEKLDSAGEAGEELVAAASSYVREHPLVALGVAVSAGYVLSRVFSSR